MLFEPPSLFLPAAEKLRVNAGMVPYSSILGAVYGLRSAVRRTEAGAGASERVGEVIA
jgi:hypothetical protein